jgi:hypothetical protein
MALVAIDWDGTLVDEHQQLLLGAREAITTLRMSGHKVVIHSCNRAKWIEKCLNEWGIPVDYIWGLEEGTGSKLVADIYIDDRGYRFPKNGDWTIELPSIMSLLKD